MRADVTQTPIAIALSDGTVVTRLGAAVIGRDPSCDVVLASAEVSRRHVAIEIRDGTVFLTDSSANGTLVGDQLVWDRSFGRPSNTVVLPAGWVLTNSSIPASVSEMPDGRIRLDFINPRPDEIAVLITARRRGR